MIEVYGSGGQPLMGMSKGGRTVAGILEWARYRLGGGATLEEVQAEVLDLDGVCLVRWPAVPSGYRIVKHIRKSDTDLTGMPEPRQTVGPLVFAGEIVADVPPPPDELTNLQFFEGLMLDLGVITPAQYDEWSLNKTLPEPFALAIAGYLADVPEPEREATEAIILGRLRQATRFPRVDPFAEIIKTALQMIPGVTMTPEAWDNFFRAAGQR